MVWYALMALLSDYHGTRAFVFKDCFSVYSVLYIFYKPHISGDISSVLNFVWEWRPLTIEITKYTVENINALNGFCCTNATENIYKIVHFTIQK